MPKTPFKPTLLAICLLLSSLVSFAQQVKEPTDVPAEWAKPYPPFQIVGNLYYVGTYELACYLITTPKGNILINTGLAGSAGLVKANIEALGFKFSDTKILLTTQAHFDHMGAMAMLKKDSGAKFIVNEKETQVLADGGKSDYALGGKTSSYAPLMADRLLRDRDMITLGNMSLTMLHHPGHTKGSSSFLFEVKDQAKTYRVLIANMPTIVTTQKFSALGAYPTIQQDYAYTLDAMKKLDFDLWLSSHASQFDLHSKHQPGDKYNPQAFMDKKGYAKSMDELTQQFSSHLAKP